MTPLRFRRPTPRVLVAATAAGLAAVAVVHLLDGPDSLMDTFYVGGLELALAAACLPLAIMLLVRPMRALWSTALLLNLAALLVFVASRTVGLPGSTDDIGNWTQTLGVINIVAELTVIALAARALSASRPSAVHAGL